MPNPSSRITVLGSINMDLVIRCPHLPRPGETIIADTAVEVCGGKGANQAVAAARLGADVTMIGAVGDDAFADQLIGNLTCEGVDVAGVARRANCASGLAIVSVEHSGENSILVVPGANGRLGVAEALAAGELIRRSDTLLLQLEVPIDAVGEAIKIARASGTRVILDPAPAPPALPPELLQVDLICPNETEAALLLGRELGSLEDAQEAARELTRRGAANVIITLGVRGAVVAQGEAVHWIEPFTVTTVDSTAAGDAFTAAVAVHWAESSDLLVAARFASAAGAIAASRAGAQAIMPTRAEIEQLLQTGALP